MTRCAYVLALAASLAGIGPAQAARPDEDALRRIWEGGTWNSDIPVGGWLSGEPSLKAYANPTFVPPYPLPLTPKARTDDRALRRSIARGHLPADPIAACHPPGMPYLLSGDSNGGFRVVMTGNELVWLYGSHDYRRIHLDGHAWPPPPPNPPSNYTGPPGPTYNGDSLGHWDGSTLVIETTNIRGENTNIEPFVPKAEGARIVERYTPAGEGRMDAVFTMESPQFTGPWVVHFHLIHDPRGAPREALCTDNGQYRRDDH